MSVKNLTDANLRVSECAFLMGVFNKMNQGGQSAHLGMIPFLHKDRAIRTLNAFLQTEGVTKVEIRFAEKVLAKIGGTFEKRDCEVFQMYLNDMKVWKFSRRVNDTTHMLLLKVVVKKAVGLQWQEFGKKWVRGEQMQNIELQLRRVKRNLWEVSCPKTWEGKAKEHLHRQYAA